MIATMLRRAALTCLAALAVVACEDDLCTQSGCVFQDPWIFVVDEGSESGALGPGDYDLTIIADGLHVEWSCSIAEDDALSSACNRDLVEWADVDSDIPRSFHIIAENRGSAVAIGLGELIHDDFATFTVPESFVLEVHRDGALAARDEYAPMIEGRWINGKGCSPYCAGSTETVELRVPATP